MWSWPITLGCIPAITILWLAPGLALSLWARRRWPSLPPTLVLLPAFSCALFVAFFVVVDVVLRDGLHVILPDIAFTILLTLFVPLALWLLGRAPPEQQLCPGLWLYCGVVAVAVTALLFDYTPLGHPLSDWTPHAKTFSGQPTIDNLFQFANGSAIVRHVPFSTYYSGGRLVYDVADREILPGIIYASFARAIPSRGDPYLVFQIMSVVISASFMLPLYALVRRLFITVRPSALFALTLGNAFVLTNTEFPWFKIAGAALSLSGICCLIDDSSRTGWLLAGLLFGIGGNMHSGSALALPAIVLLFAWRQRRDAVGGRLTRMILLASGFVVVSIPWTLVKRFWLIDNSRLIKQFLFAGFGFNTSRSALATALDYFLHATSWHEQIAGRWAQLRGLLATTELGILSGFVALGDWRGFVFYWNRDEFKYVGFIFFPSLLVFLFALSRRRAPASPPASLAIQLYVTSVISTLALMLIAFVGQNGSRPDMSTQHPTAILLLLYVVPFGLALEQGKRSAKIVAVTVAVIIAAKLLLGYYVQAQNWPAYDAVWLKVDETGILHF